MCSKVMPEPFRAVLQHYSITINSSSSSSDTKLASSSSIVYVKQLDKGKCHIISEVDVTCIEEFIFNIEEITKKEMEQYSGIHKAWNTDKKETEWYDPFAFWIHRDKTSLPKTFKRGALIRVHGSGENDGKKYTYNITVAFSSDNGPNSNIGWVVGRMTDWIPW